MVRLREARAGHTHGGRSPRPSAPVAALPCNGGEDRSSRARGLVLAQRPLSALPAVGRSNCDAITIPTDLLLARWAADGLLQDVGLAMAYRGPAAYGSTAVLYFWVPRIR
jgi:hypothetical protein